MHERLLAEKCSERCLVPRAGHRETSLTVRTTHAVCSVFAVHTPFKEIEKKYDKIIALANEKIPQHPSQWP